MSLRCRATGCSQVVKLCKCPRSLRRPWQADGQYPGGETRWAITSDEAMTRKEAESWFEKEKRERRGNPLGRTPLGRHTVTDAANAFLDHRAAKVRVMSKRAATHSNHVGIVNNYLLPKFGTRPIESLTAADVVRFATQLQEGLPKEVLTARLATFEKELRRNGFASRGEEAVRARIAAERDRIMSNKLSARTIRMIVNVLKLVLDHALLERWVTMNVAAGAPLDIGNDAKARFALTGAECDAVAWAVDGADPRDRLPVLLMIRYGLRRGEVFGLQRRDVDSVRGRLHIERILDRDGEAGPVKKRSNRVIPARAIDERLFSELAAFAANRHVVAIDGSDWLFTTEDGKPLVNNQDRFWRSKVIPALVSTAASVERAEKLRGVTFHYLRHTAATRMQEASPLSRSQAGVVLGHKDEAMTAHYTHPELDAIERALAASNRCETAAPGRVQ
jgi:integrase